MRIDGVDNESNLDRDDYIDQFDPDCENPPNYWQETDEEADANA